jgi:Ca2+/H+ antiporter
VCVCVCVAITVYWFASQWLIVLLLILWCRMRSWYVVTFIMSLVYLAGLTVAMVYLVTRASMSFGISTAIIGVIFVSWGTSAPDCLSSLIVARRGMVCLEVPSPTCVEYCSCLTSVCLVTQQGRHGCQ